MKVGGILKNEMPTYGKHYIFHFPKYPKTLVEEIFWPIMLHFNYTRKIGARHYVGLMASNLVENVKHMIIINRQKKFRKKSIYQSKMYITTSPKRDY
jgi:hypothetical protein